MNNPTPPRWTRFALAAALVAGATAIAAPGFGAQVLSEADAVMIFLAAITAAAVWLGRGPSLMAAALAVASFDFFCVPPFHTFTVERSRHLLTFAMMFATGVLLSGLVQRLRRQEDEAAQKELSVRTEQMRSTLLSAVSHDLRTPLASITGAATTLRNDPGRLSVEERTTLLDDIASEAFRLERLVASLLDMTRVQSGSLAPKREWVPTEEIVGSALARVEERLAGRSIDVTLAPEVPQLDVDPVLFAQVLVNLLENVARHTPAATPVSVVVRKEGANAVLEVLDRGPGLPAGLDVFEKFVRGPRASGGGVGLGLAICRGIVEAHGGQLRGENREGGGAVFSVSLPLGLVPVWSQERA